MTTTTDQIMSKATMSTIDGLKRCIDALEAHARELEKKLNEANRVIDEMNDDAFGYNE